MARMQRWVLGVSACLVLPGGLAACTTLLGDFTSGPGASDASNGGDGGDGGDDSSMPGVDSSVAADTGAESQADSMTGPDVATMHDSGPDAPSCTPDGGDPLNCGTCGHSCQGGLCIANQCTPLSISGPTQQPLTIAANETKVFWRSADGSLMSEPVVGATSGTSFYVSGDAPTYCGGTTGCANITLDSTTAYWPDLPSNGPIIQSQTVGGSSAFPFGTLQSHINEYTYVVQDGTTLFAVNYSEVVQGGGCPTTGVDTMTIQPRSNTSTTWSGPFCWIDRMAVDATNLYWTDHGAPNGQEAPGVYLVPKLGSFSTRIAPAANPIGIALYQGSVYWTDSGTGNVMSWKQGGQPSTLATSSSPSELAVDGSGVYWIDGNTTILHAPLTGSSVTPSTLASGQVDATSIATNSTSIFWVNEGTSAHNFQDGAVMKLAK